MARFWVCVCVRARVCVRGVVLITLAPGYLRIMSLYPLPSFSSYFPFLPCSALQSNLKCPPSIAYRRANCFRVWAGQPNFSDKNGDEKKEEIIVFFGLTLASSRFILVSLCSPLLCLFSSVSLVHCGPLEQSRADAYGGIILPLSIMRVPCFLSVRVRVRVCVWPPLATLRDMMRNTDEALSDQSMPDSSLSLSLSLSLSDSIPSEQAQGGKYHSLFLVSS